MLSNQEHRFEDCCQAFADSYEVSNLPAMREVERTVLGCDYGGTSWTTSAQADQLIGSLGLRPGCHLLDIGSGSGWPGLYVADVSGCEVTLLDLPTNALAMASRRALADGIDDRVNAVVGSGAVLPFRKATFDAISHSDVLCCLPEKLTMLEECRRIATDGATMAFSVIAIAHDLSDDDHQKAIDAGPPFVDAPKDYVELMSICGWRMTDRADVTDEYKRSLNSLINAFDNDAELLGALGEDAVREACERRQEQVDVIDAGLLVRDLFTAVAI